jgi:UDP-N-acetylmuramoyl-tripeptide--D-alanyl-D-alanine ligase
MDHMFSVLKPDVGILTNIGISHLEKFGTRSAIAHEKGRLFHRDIQAGIHLPRLCPFIRQIERESGIMPVRMTFRRCMPRTGAFRMGPCHWKSPCHVNAVGAHLLSDIAGAVETARFLGVADDAIAAGLRDSRPWKDVPPCFPVA